MGRLLLGSILMFSLMLEAAPTTNVSEEDLTRFMIPVVRNGETLLEGLNPGNAGQRLVSLLKSSRDSEVVLALFVVMGLENDLVKGVRVSPPQLEKMRSLAREHTAAASPYIRLAAFQTFADPLMKARPEVSVRELEAIAARENEPVLKKLMQGMLSQIHFYRQSLQQKTEAKVAMDSRKLEGMQVIISSAVWCTPCVVLKKSFAADKFPESGQMTLSMRGGGTLSLPYEIVDVDKQAARAKKLRLGPAIPNVYLVKDDQIVLKADFLAVELTTAGFRELAEQMAYEVSRVKDSDGVNVKTVNQLLQSKAATPSALMLMSTGRGVEDTPLFSMETTLQLKNYLRTSGKPDGEILTLYGSGQEQWSDTRGTLGGAYLKIFKAEVGSDLSFTRENLMSSVEALNRAGTKRALEVFIGHGQHDGFSLWQDHLTLGERELKDIFSAAKFESVFVSGLCFGGQFAQVPRCGFFAARPDRPAAGCWLERNPGMQMKDYTSTFFSTLSPEVASNADADKDGKVSFEEAHWYATMKGNRTDTPFSTYDSLVAEEFRQNSTLPDSIRIGDIAALEKHLTPAEKVYWNSFRKELDDLVKKYPDKKIALRKNKLYFTVQGFKFSKSRPGLAEVADSGENGEADYGDGIELSRKIPMSVRAKFEAEAEALKSKRVKEGIGDRMFSSLQLIPENGVWKLRAFYGEMGTDTITWPQNFTPDNDEQGLYYGQISHQIGQLLKSLIVRANVNLVKQPARFDDVMSCEKQEVRGYIK